MNSWVQYRNTFYRWHTSINRDFIGYDNILGICDCNKTLRKVYNIRLSPRLKSCFQVWNSKLFVRSAWIPSSPAKYVTIIFSQGFIAWRQDNTRKAELEGRTDLGATTIRHDRTNIKFALFSLYQKGKDLRQKQGILLL